MKLAGDAGKKISDLKAGTKGESPAILLRPRTVFLS